MKPFVLPIAILTGILFIYVFSYWIYDYTDVISSSSVRSNIRPLYEPCIDIGDTWQARQARKEAELEFFGEWEGNLVNSDAKMSIKKNGQLTIKYGSQTILGKGKFQEIDGGLYFIVETNCQLDKETQSYTQLISDYRDITPNDQICRIKIHVFQADNPDKFQLAAGIEIYNLKETENYGIAMLIKSSP